MLPRAPRFAVLATFCCLVALTHAPLVTAGVVQPRPPDGAHAQRPISHDRRHPRLKSDYRADNWLNRRAMNPLDVTIGARHRYHTNVAKGRRRNDVIIPSKNGRLYFLSHAKSSPVHWDHGSHPTVFENRGEGGQPDHFGITGGVDIMSHVDKAANPSAVDRKLASLCIPNGDGVVQACEKDRDRALFHLVKVPVVFDSSSEVLVYLEALQSNATSYKCVTYDSHPGSAHPMTMTDCRKFDEKQDIHQSQLFAFNETSNAIRPMRSTQDEAAAASSSGGSSSTGGAHAMATSVGSRPTGQNVSLLFVPQATEDAFAITTTTVTTTVTVDARTTHSFSDASSVAAASVSASPASVQPSVTGSLSVVTGSTSVANSAAPTTTPANALNVEVVGSSSSLNMSSSSTTSGEAVTSSMPEVISTAALESSSSAPLATASPSASMASEPASVAGISATSTSNASSSATSVSPSESATDAATQPTMLATAQQVRREYAETKMQPVGTEPYEWKFKEGVV